MTITFFDQKMKVLCVEFKKKLEKPINKDKVRKKNN